jgi:L-serine dehydratase
MQTLNPSNDANAKAGSLRERILSSQGDASAEPIGVFDLFKIGIGPSSSHTIGPMKAAAAFVNGLGAASIAQTHRVVVTLFGSLAWTGIGHATDKAILLGLCGHLPDRVDPDDVDLLVEQITSSRSIVLPQQHKIAFDRDRDLLFDKIEMMHRHPNAMSFQALGADGNSLKTDIWYSIGGGFIEAEQYESNTATTSKPLGIAIPSGADLLEICDVYDCTIADIAFANECGKTGEAEVISGIDQIIDVMMACVDRGLRQSGQLPGPLKVQRRAQSLYQKAEETRHSNIRRPSEPFDYISAFAIAVNEENATGGRVVTAPTNGAAGVIPAVLRYYRDFCPGADRSGMQTFLLTATAIGGIIKKNASISGAEVGCQGEVGSAAAMAAAGLSAALGATNAQIENAAEIAMEHHLGMTCDPIAGLVQIPCIERNAFGAIKAVNAAYLALAGDGSHRVSLDQVIETMRQTGADMHDKYRETSRGGLAISVPEC